MATTFTDYSRQIVARIPQARKNDTTGFLVKPSPAQLRNFCEHLCKSGLDEADLATLRSFLLVSNKEENLLPIIRKIDIDKFRPIQNLLKGKISNPSHIIIEMTAILINFEPRPYAKFQNWNNGNRKNADETVLENKDENEILPIVKNDRKQKKRNRKKITQIGIATAGSVALTFLGVNYFNKSKANCMQWQTDHFEKVDCELIEQNSLHSQNPIEVYNSELFKLKRIEVDENTIFFKKNKAVVFYCKLNDSVIEFYNSPGFHPVLDKPLKPITNYMIKKYIEK